MDLIAQLEAEQIASLGKDIPDFKPGDTVRVGPHATVGIWTMGAGLRAVITPLQAKGGARHGLELRATALWPSTTSGEGMVLYTGWFDPRRGSP